jgi:hypothetical protein
MEDDAMAFERISSCLQTRRLARPPDMRTRISALENLKLGKI